MLLFWEEKLYISDVAAKEIQNVDYNLYYWY